MTILSFMACIAMVWRLSISRSRSVLVGFIERFTPHPALTRTAGVSLVLLYACELMLDLAQTRFDNVTARVAWMSVLPLPVYDGESIAEAGAWAQAILSAVGLSIGILQTTSLAVIVIAVRRRSGGIETPAIIGLACALALLSLLAPALSTTDPYEYVATGMLGLRAYAPPPGAFAGTAYAAIAQHIPLSGVIYGPLWVLIDTAQTAFGSSIYEKIEAIRGWNVGLIAATLWLLARAGVSRAALVAFALNPAVWYFSVAVPHADIEAVCFLAAAYAAACRSKTSIATAFIIAAGLVKLPFVVAGGALLSVLPNAPRRCAAWAIALAIVAICSSTVAGGAYAAKLSQYAASGSRIDWPQHWIAFASILSAVTVLLLATRRGIFGTAWFFHQMAPIAAPWYIFWGIPYALATAGLELYLVAFPLAATQTACVGTESRWLAFAGILILALDVCVSRYRAERAALTTSSF